MAERNEAIAGKLHRNQFGQLLCRVVNIRSTFVVELGGWSLANKLSRCQHIFEGALGSSIFTSPVRTQQTSTILHAQNSPTTTWSLLLQS